MHPTLEQALKLFLESLRVDRGSSRHTVESYERDLAQFFQTLSPERALQEIEAPDLESHLTALTRAGQKATSLARKASVLRQFFKFCYLSQSIRTHPAERLMTGRLPSRLPKTLSHEAIDCLLKTVGTGIHGPAKEALNQRDRAMVFLLYATGLRVSELLGLKIENIDIAEGYLRVRGKGNKERLVPFAPIAGEWIMVYLNESRPQLEPMDSTLFVGQSGKPLTRQAFWKTLRDIARAAGLDQRVSPHLLRHAFATHLLESGMNLRALQMLLGHSDLSTTQIYTHVSPQHLKAAHRKFHPRGGG